MLQAKRRRRGYSLIELGIVLGVVAGLIVGVLFLAQTISTQNRLTQLNQFVTRVVATTIRIMSFEGSISANSNLVAVLDKTGEFPDNAFEGSGVTRKFKTPFSGATFQVRGAADNRLALLFTDMPENACFSVVQNMLQSRDALHFINIKQGLALTTRGTASDSSGSLTVSTATASDIAGKCADDVELLVIYK